METSRVVRKQVWHFGAKECNKRRVEPTLPPPTDDREATFESCGFWMESPWLEKEEEEEEFANFSF